MIRKVLHKILGIDRVITQLNGRVTLIENIVGINSFMADEGNVGSGNVGVGSTVPPDVARYQELAKAQGSGNVGVGSTAPAGNVGHESSGNIGSTDNPGNVGVGSTVPAVGDGNVGIGSATTETQSLCPPNEDTVGIGSTVPAIGDSSVGVGSTVPAIGDGNV
tara:strand:+ start:812 stop:1300 length:489 start_codon:yes stop_codon:yes gene_type:complete